MCWFSCVMFSLRGASFGSFQRCFLGSQSRIHIQTSALPVVSICESCLVVQMQSVAAAPRLPWPCLTGHRALALASSPLYQAETILLEWQVPENAVDLFNFTSSVFYLRDIHLIGKELNFSLQYHHSDFILFRFKDITWKVIRNEFSG